MTTRTSTKTRKFAMYSTGWNYGDHPLMAGGSVNTAFVAADMIPDHPHRETYRRAFLAWSETAKPGDVYVGRDTWIIVCVRKEESCRA